MILVFIFRRKLCEKKIKKNLDSQVQFTRRTINMNMNQKQLNVAMKPVENSANQYIALTCSCIEKTGVRLYAFSSIFRSFPLFLKTDLVIFNWFETLKARRFRFQKIIRLIKKRIVLILLKITGKKIVFVFHM